MISYLRRSGYSTAVAYVRDPSCIKTASCCEILCFEVQLYGGGLC